jgi:hypothetical protein
MEQNSASEIPSDTEPETTPTSNPTASTPVPEATPETDPVPEPETDSEPAEIEESAEPLDAGEATEAAEATEATPEKPARDPAKMGKPEARVLRFLRAKITPSLPDDIGTAVGIEVKPLKRLLGKMAREGLVRRSGGGRFTTSRFRRDA